MPYSHPPAAPVKPYQSTGLFELGLMVPIKLIGWIAFAVGIASSLALISAITIGIQNTGQFIDQLQQTEATQNKELSFNQYFYQMKQSLFDLMCKYFKINQTMNFFKSFLINNQNIYTVWQKILPYWAILYQTTHLVLLRALNWISTLPLWILTAWIAIVDGLVARDLRRFNGSRESTFKFHSYQSIIPTWIRLNFLILLLMPIHLSIDIWLLPSTLLFGVLIRQTLTYFKKYA